MKPLAITFLISLMTLTGFSQTDPYLKLWKQVESYELDNLPKSALKAVNDIATLAKKEGNKPQEIKTLIYKSKFALILEEDAQLKVIQDFKSEIHQAEAPTKNLLENMLATMYWQYFQQNRWKIYNRTETTQKVDSVDFRTWDLNTLFKEIQKHFQASLEPSDVLKETPIETFKLLLTEQKDSKIYRPTLYDLLAHNALEFYKTDESSITKPDEAFEIDNDRFLCPADEFSSLNITSTDSTSLPLKALKLYQDLIQFHQTDTQADALVDVDIERLNFVESYASFPDKQDILIRTLKESQDNYSGQAVSTLYGFEEAQQYYYQGQGYQPRTQEENRWKVKKAYDLCEQLIKNFPESIGAEKCEVLQSYISRESLNLMTESHLPIQQHSKVLVTYKNIQALEFKVFKLTEKQYKTYQENHREDLQWEFIKKLTASDVWETTLKDEGDYQSHSTEVLVPQLDNGRYLMVALVNNEANTFAAQTFQVTNLAITETSDELNQYYQVINRINGAPIAKAKVVLSYQKNYNGSYITKSFTSDSKGMIQIQKPNEYWRNITIEVTYGNDQAHFGNHYISQHYNRSETDVDYKGFVFTDRSIYRPGQTVYFKAIAMKTTHGKSEVIPNQLFYVDVYDVNDDEVAELELKSNEYGSVAGEFILPSYGLNGQYNINFYGDGNDLDVEYYFSVEEYKRPKFETKFTTITDTFRVNDSVTVHGTALAFAGSNITDAKVTYRVVRQVQYPIWYRWNPRAYYSEPQEIAHGETTTNAQGEFEVVFKALPDTAVSKESQPIFQYEVTADVTDINGETRSATTTANVGYHALTASIQAPSKWDKTNKKESLTLITNNLNGTFVPTEGFLKIYKLQAPEHVLRDRPWSAPDYPLMTQAEFKTYFPHEAYQDENDVNTWELGTLVKDMAVNTKDSKEVILGNMKSWESGLYKIIFETKDRFDQVVKAEQQITVFSPKDKTLADHQLFQFHTDKDRYQVGEHAVISVGSAAENMTVSIDIEKEHQIVETKLLTLNTDMVSFEIPITEKDLGGFAIHYSFAFANGFESGSQTIQVPYPSSDLQIETKTFRDKLQPGSEETWSFTIKGPKGEQVSAELLASMYDASLDQFKTHNWRFDPLYEPIYSNRGHRGSGQSFGSSSFRIFNQNRQALSYPHQSYDALNWFGFHLTNKWFIKQYLNEIRIRDIKSKYDSSISKGFISGTVTDEYGSPIPGVNVVIKGTNNGTQTDFDGNFLIQADNNDQLIFSFVGYTNLNYQVKTDNALFISLTPDSNNLDEVVVTALGFKRKKDEITTANQIVKAEELTEAQNSDVVQGLSGKVSGLQINTIGGGSRIVLRGNRSETGDKQALLVLDGKIVSVEELESMDPSLIANVNILKGANGAALYGSQGANGVFIITTKKAILQNIKARKNLQETAFFFPQLQTDKDGNVSFSFTTPEALTQWKLQLLAHTKTLESQVSQLNTMTQKELMVLPNVPRFLRQGDVITISTKISNLSDKALSGHAMLQLQDASTGKDITNELLFLRQAQDDNQGILPFSVEKQGNTQVSWNLHVPDHVDAVQYKIVAQAGEFSDGEQNALPVLSNRMLVTETLPMWIKSNETRTFTLDKLKTNTSTTLKHHKLTLEITSNPAWYAVQALPYLMEYPYECNEQTFSRYYANALASHIANSNPRIKEVFDQWRNSDALISNLEKNEELKSLLIQETPWLRDAQSETEQKKRIALLFDMNKMTNELQNSLKKLEQNQMGSGAWAWFNGGKPNRFITQHIITGFGHLGQLGVTTNKLGQAQGGTEMIKKALNYLDQEFVQEYKDLTKYRKDVDLSKDHLSYSQIQYLYMLSFYPKVELSKEVATIKSYYMNQIKDYWTSKSLYIKGMMALVAFRNQDSVTANKILKSLKETSITNDELGMYWKDNVASWYWHQAPIETQALMIEAFSEIENDMETVDNLKIWLLKNKQTNQWKTTKATTEAVYALLLQGSDWLSVTDAVEVVVGNQKIEPSKLENVKVEAGTGYYKTSWSASEIQPELADVTLSKKGNGIAWGSLYWQYFEDLDAITSAESPLSLKKKLFLKTNTHTGEKISEITKDTTLKVGDLVRVRIELKSDRDMEFIHMKDMRAAGLEPINVLSAYKYQDGLGYYESTKDASTNFFFDYLPKGVYVFEYDLRVNNAGEMSNGITTIQSMYAPEFSSHSEGQRIHIK
ncbi:carboxypeptidase-like regulatory domain-containing protein [Mangrovimonas sp. CR14]|uniref:alpha-2-macroglobulin family protein n=1 Tax=Mangrovimonas sp. CR14 TaxID=2706120 RepID=UPI001F0FE7E5|nr:carboxypeptidase-like regulatory domain-containing protein [Mangrovimonas sp. CR14]